MGVSILSGRNAFHPYIKSKSRLGLDGLDVFQTTTSTIREPAADACFSSLLPLVFIDQTDARYDDMIGLHTTSTTKRSATSANIATHGREKTPPARIATTIAHFQCRFSKTCWFCQRMGSVGANLVMLQKQVGWGNCARGLGGKRTITAGDAIVPTIGSSDYHSQSLSQYRHNRCLNLIVQTMGLIG